VGPDGELRVRVRPPAADGAANEALLRVLAEALGVRRSAVAIERGHGSRLKGIIVEGKSADELSALWPGLDVTSI
jgi:uncharacterized protein YggU (UPF0235/DUF167 family)